MAHQLVLVLIGNLQSSVEDQVTALMAAHIGDTAQPELCFDYYKIGGRWSGVFAGMFPDEQADGVGLRFASGRPAGVEY